MTSKQSNSDAAAQVEPVVSHDPMRAGDVASASDRTATDLPQAQVKTTPHMPHWASWNERPVATLHEAVCLAHGINPPGYWKLDDDDPRLTRFRPHLKTLRQWITYYKIRIAPAQDYDDVPDNDTRIVLRDFVDCVVAKELFRDLYLPDEFRGLKPPLPHEFQGERKVSAPDDAPLRESKQTADENVRKNKTWARLVILMAMEHYNFMPAWPPEELTKPKKVLGLYQPLADLSEKWGVSLLRDRGTVRDAILEAVRTIDKEEVLAILTTVEKRKKLLRIL